ncbi:MAG: threonylcarbamoyl-AMP synthase [Chloroflexi bacterium]|nr:threonylcarbamoyl-AMP synthase [Chloroflexota bacterium]
MDERGIQEGVRILKRGGIVAFPTDTVYGLGCDAFNEQAVKRIYAVKRRPSTQGVPVHLARVEQVSIVAVEVSEAARRLMERFWPGALTIVLKKSAKVPDIVTGGPTIAVRVPDHPAPRALTEGLGWPIVGTSANAHGRPSPVSAEEVAAQLRDVDLIVRGECYRGVESTIVDCTGEKVRVLRWGAIGQKDLEITIGPLGAA